MTCIGLAYIAEMLAVDRNVRVEPIRTAYLSLQVKSLAAAFCNLYTLSKRSIRLEGLLSVFGLAPPSVVLLDHFKLVRLRQQELSRLLVLVSLATSRELPMTANLGFILLHLLASGLEQSWFTLSALMRVSNLSIGAFGAGNFNLFANLVFSVVIIRELGEVKLEDTCIRASRW